LDKLNKTFCYDIFKNIAIRSHNTQVGYSPCSFTNDTSNMGQTDNVSIVDVWDKQAHKDLKQKSLSNQKIPGCSYCYEQEEKNLPSRRLANFELYEKYLNDADINNGPIGLDYSVGNLCNLQCAICHPGNSSSWIPDYKKLNPNADASEYLYRKNKQTTITEQDTKLDQIKNVHFHGGGEPLLSHHHVELLQAIKNAKGSLGDVHVFYNTNGTVKVDNEVLNLWSECRLVELYFSIDDIEQRFEYQRPGASWKVVTDTINWYRNNMPVNHMFKINCVVSYLNFFYLPELVEWHNKFLFENRLGDPVLLIFDPYRSLMLDFTLNSLTQTQHDKVKVKFHNYPQLLKILESITIDDSQTHKTFEYNVKTFNGLKSSDYATHFKEWVDILNLS